MKLREVFWHKIPPTRVGVFSGRIKCPCEVQFWEALEQVVPECSGTTLVDLGCGPGIKSLTLALAGSRVIGFDTRECSIRHAQENLRQIREGYPTQSLEAEFYHKDIQVGIPEIADHSVDLVLFIEVIEHLERYPIVLEEIKRILKPGGLVVITTPNKRFHQKAPDEQVYGEKAYGHVREFDLKELVDEVERAGLTIVSTRHVNTRACTVLCRWIHPWMIRDHGFLQQKHHIDDVIGIRTLGFLQPIYNRLFFLISTVIAAYNAALFPALTRMVAPKTEVTEGKSVFVVGTPE